MSPLESALRDAVRDLLPELLREDAAFRDEVRQALALAERDEYLSPTTAAEIADVAPATVRRWVREGRLPGYGVGGRHRVRRSDLDRLLAGSPRRGRETPEERALRDFG